MTVRSKLVRYVSIFCVSVAGVKDMASSDSSTDHAIIINNIQNNGDSNSSVKFEKREGAEKDDENLRFVFVDKLGFHLLNGTDVSEELRRSLTLKQWKCGPERSKQCKKCIQCLITFSEMENCKSFLFALSSHGVTKDDGLHIQFIDGFVPLHEIISFLKDCNCLKGKTVILVVEACRSGVGTQGR